MSVLSRSLRTVRSTLGIGSLADWLFRQATQTSALLVLGLVGLIIALLTVQAWPAIRGLGPSILLSADWDPARHRFGGLAFLYGSIVTSLLALILAVPLGVGSATFLAEVASARLRRIGSFLIELSAAIPSVVYGLWGVHFLAPSVQRLFNALGGPNVGGKGLFSASLILAIMIVPTIAAITHEACRAVPGVQRDGALALGATRWQTIWSIVLPYARPGIVGSCFLALGRAIGETMAVVMLIGNAAVVELPLFGRGATIPSLLAQELPSSGSRLEDAALLELSLLLFLITIALNSLARLLIGRKGVRNLFATKKVPGTFFLPAVWMDRAMTGVMGLCLVLTCVPLFLILGYISYRGVGALSWDFFVRLPKPRGEIGGGLAQAIVGSGILVGLAVLIALPLAFLAAVFLSERRTNRIAPVVRFFGELLGGVPSIVIGTFVYALMQSLIRAGMLGPRQQFSGWAGAFALAILMTPILLRAFEDAFRLVPQSLRDASYALGAHQGQTVWRIIVPAALPALVTGAFLALARIAGETAPLLMTAFGNEKMTLNPRERMASLPLYIYRYAQSGDRIFEEQAWAAALVLLALVILLNVGARILTDRPAWLRASRVFSLRGERRDARLAQLEEDRQQLRTILSGMVEGVVALDAEQRILYANERAMNLLGLPRQAPVGRYLWEVVRNRPFLNVVARALEKAEPQREELAWTGLAVRSLTVHAARLPGLAPRGAVIVLHDTSELRRLERLRQEFVANVSHELKTPLSVIKVCVETLLDDAAIEEPQRRHFLEQIFAQGERLDALIHDLLSLARIESGEQLFEFQSVRAAEVVQTCIERHRPRALAKQQQLELAPPDDAAALAVWADEEAIEHILDNLLDNAVKYTPSGGHIRVGWHRRGEQVCLEVSDTGIGIPEADLPRIFERFYRVDKARSREMGGTGLGLSIVKHLTQAMHGSVAAVSELGQGTTFTVCLPAASEPRP